MTLSETIRALSDAKARASQPPSENFIDRAASETSIAMAKNEIVALTKQVKALAGQASGGIFVSGPGSKQFAAIAEDEGGAVTIDAGQMYETIADAVEQTMARNNTREWRLDIIQTLVSNMTGLGQKLGIVYMPPINTTKYTRSLLEDRAATLAMVRDVIRGAVADELNGVKLQQDVTDAIVAAEYEQNVVPVVVLNAHEDDVAGLGALVFGGRYVTVTTKEVVDKQDVITAFKHLKPLLKRTN